MDENSNDARYLLCISPEKKSFGIAFIDPTTGTIQTSQSHNPHRAVEIMSLLPIQECIYPQGEETKIKMLFKHPLLKAKDIILSPHEDWCFNSDIAKKTLCTHFSVHSLAGFGIEGMPSSISSAGALLEYLKQMNKQPLRHIDKISLYSDNDYVFISPAASYGLELQTLFKTINHTLTSMGKRNLHYWLYHPLKTPAAILQRQAAVTLLKKYPEIQQKLKVLLHPFPDIEKSISKLSCGYMHAKDLLAIRNSLSILPELTKVIGPLSEKNRLFSVEDIPALRELLERTINPDMPITKPEGKIIQKGYDRDLDSLRDIQENGREWLKNFQLQEIKRTGINSLKVGYNKVFGYYIEVTKANLKSVPENFIRKQTLVNGERFITPELKEYEEKILTAQEKILRIENEILQKLQKEILDHSVALHEYARSIAVIDCFYSLCLLAQKNNFVAPNISNDAILDIKEGRHPVVETTLVENFIPNDTYLDCEENHLIILTGPNMAGKSTYIRQIALLVILAQMGSYIPARSAHIGVVDKVFTRIGAHDDITKGQSTFMVEMNEMADILNNLTDKSLIILDEIGRGTSTYDGLSLAWALAEHLQKNKARTLFATHFHELTALAEEHSGVKNYNVAVKEWKDEIIFLHKIVPGSTDDSYGIYVAQLAGIPKNIIARSKKILAQLELKNNLKERMAKDKNAEMQLSFFSGNTIDPEVEEVLDIIKEMDLDNITPLEAINKLQQLKERIEK